MTDPKALEAVARAIGASSLGTDDPWYWQARYDSHGDARMHRDDDRTMARAALSALRAAGYAVVPVEPSAEAIELADDKLQRGYGPKGVWSAMLEAASPSLVGDGEGGR
jgi:hypothetical protein